MRDGKFVEGPLVGLQGLANRMTRREIGSRFRVETHVAAEKFVAQTLLKAHKGTFYGIINP